MSKQNHETNAMKSGLPAPCLLAIGVAMACSSYHTAAQLIPYPRSAPEHRGLVEQVVDIERCTQGAAGAHFTIQHYNNSRKLA